MFATPGAVPASVGSDAASALSRGVYIRPSMFSCCTKPAIQWGQQAEITKLDLHHISASARATPVLQPALVGCRPRSKRVCSQTSEFDAGLLRLVAPRDVLMRVPAALGCIVHLTYLQAGTSSLSKLACAPP